MSPYRAPGFLVRKKNKKWRLVVDYCRINKKALLINLPLPHMNQFNATSHGKKRIYTARFEGSVLLLKN